MHYTKVIALVMTTVGMMAPAVAAPVPDSGTVNCANGACYRPVSTYGRIEKRQQDFVNIDPDLYGNTGGVDQKRHTISDFSPEAFGETVKYLSNDVEDEPSFPYPDTSDEANRNLKLWVKHGTVQKRRYTVGGHLFDSPGTTEPCDNMDPNGMSCMPPKHQDSISKATGSNPEVDDPTNADPDLWGKQGSIINKREREVEDPDGCNPKNECGGPMGMRPFVPPIH